ncbi:MAG: RNA polymerase sigma factor [Planctomycetota bacterium]
MPDDSVSPAAGDDSEPPTVILVRRAVAGDDAAFHDLFRRHYQRVVQATALHEGWLLRDCRDEVEDAVHEAFADVFQRMRSGAIADIESIGAFRAYVRTAASHAVHRHRRHHGAQKRGGRRVRRRADLVADDEGSVFAELGVDAAGPGTLLGDAEDLARRQQLLEEAVQALPQPYRAALELSVYCGLTNAEIAASGDLRSSRDDQPIRTPTAVKVVVFRARQLLRTRLGVVGGD